MPSTLDTLPTEIIAQVAKNCTCTAACTLLRVNRRLYHICNDRLIFTHIAVTSYLALSPERSWKHQPVLDHVSLDEAKQLALAVQKAVELDFFHRTSLFEDLGHSLIGFSNETARWLPHLVALHHPCIYRLNTSALLRQLRQLVNKSASTTHISQDTVTALATTLLHAINAQSLAADADPATLALSRLHLLDFQPLNRANPPISESTSRIDPYYAITAALKIASTLQTLRPDQRSAFLDSAPLPSFHNTLSTPLYTNVIPFATTVRDLCAAHLNTMTSPQFLSSGLWTGYYSYGRARSSSTRLDPPMTRISLIASAPSSSFSAQSLSSSDNHVVAEISDRSNGVDNVGPFTLSGAVFANGEVRIHKRYAGFGWDWMGWLLPVGIVGVWGRGARESERGGHFWIWKAEWTC